VGKTLTIRVENAILLGKFSTSGRRFEIHLAEAMNFQVGILSSTLPETIIIRPGGLNAACLGDIPNIRLEIAMLCGKVSTSGRRIISGPK